jgi:hypothetical protein
LERVIQRDWFACPRCGTQARQTWLSTPAPGAPRQRVRWSICAACDRVTIWEGARIVHPPASPREADAPRGAPAAPNAATLRAFWDAVGTHLEGSWLGTGREATGGA